MASFTSCPVVVSAPGKVILHGEHAVVYGKPALAASVDLRCYAVLYRTQGSEVTLSLPDLGHQEKWSVLALVRGAVSDDEWLDHLRQISGAASETPPTHCTATLVFLFLLTHICADTLKEGVGLSVTVISTMPPSAGLGSSAAYSVCLAAGLLVLGGAVGKGEEDEREGEKGEEDEGEKVEEGEGEKGEEVEDGKQEEGRGNGEPKERNEHAQGRQGGDCEDNKKSKEATKRKQDCASLLPPPLPKSVLDVSGCVEGGSSECGECGECRQPWRREELERINQWALRAERLIHGTPSGIDNSVSTHGGAIKFHSGQIEFLQRMPQLRILLVNTKVPRSTKKMVSGVRELYNRHPVVVGTVLESVGAISIRAETLLSELFDAYSSSSSGISVPSSQEIRIHRKLHDLVEMNHHLLNALGVGHDALDRVCAVVRCVGLAGKLTGAGGGGCALVLVPPGFSDSVLSETISSLTSSGLDCWETTIGSWGVYLHQSHAP